MPLIIEHDAKVAARIDAAVERIEAKTPREKPLKTRLLAGTLKLNFDTVSIESGVKRHLFDKRTSLYAAQHASITAKMKARGKSVPLAKQLDAARKELSRTEGSLERSRAHVGQLNILIGKKDLEIARLRELLSNAGIHEPGDTGTGAGQVIGLPPPERAEAGRRRRRA